MAGALSMAAGEYVSVSSQADAEDADLALERRELARTPERERAELTASYIARGLTTDLARQVTNIAPIDQAGAGDLSFVSENKFIASLKSTQA